MSLLEDGHDREGLAEMSCIAGVGGNVRSLVRKACHADFDAAQADAVYKELGARVRALGAAASGQSCSQGSPWKRQPSTLPRLPASSISPSNPSSTL